MQTAVLELDFCKRQNFKRLRWSRPFAHVVACCCPRRVIVRDDQATARQNVQKTLTNEPAGVGEVRFTVELQLLRDAKSA